MIEGVAQRIASVSPNMHVQLLEHWSPGVFSSTTPEVDRDVMPEEVEAAYETFRRVGLQRGLEKRDQDAGV